jgi:hypothetical protein
MSKRNVATFLWFIAGWTVGALATFFLGLPSGLNVVLAVTAAAVVWWDPTHRLWPIEPRIVRSGRISETSHRGIGAD